MLRIDEIGHGVIAEKFEDEMTRVVENITDVNTEAKTVREVTIKVKIKPDPENRSLCKMEVVATSKLAAMKPYASKVTVGMDRETGEVDAQEMVSMQPELFSAVLDKKEV